MAVEATAEIFEQYQPGLKDLEGFSHAIFLYFFHRSTRTTLVGRPYLEKEEHGIYAIRSPHRPNHLGLSIVRIKSIIENKIIFKDVDMLNGTPLLDIKPYSNHFDRRDIVKSGWIDKHFRNGKIPDNLSSK